MKKGTMALMIMGGLGMAGYMYMMKNPQVMKNMRQMMKSAAKCTYDKLEEMDN